jgi:thiamine pyrophosphate-dependent acetolactate synthase large subunit-like protein
LPVAILGDGDYLMALTAIWTAASNRGPLLIVVAKNQSPFNDELHQERVAHQRGRPIENRSVGLRMSDPPFNLAFLTEGQGVKGLGLLCQIPVRASKSGRRLHKRERRQKAGRNKPGGSNA